MTRTTMKQNATRLLSAFFALLALGAANAPAQPVYRIVGPDGRVTFSDKPPAASDKAGTTGALDKSAGGSGTALPYELRQVVSRYPVTLYTSTNCAPCDSGRSFLGNRGIPFVERTVNTPEDIAALQRLSSESSLPFLTIGSQQIKGYSNSEWVQFLDAAGYPKTSQLPAGYRSPAPEPLVALKKPAPAPVEASQARSANGVPAAEPMRPPAANPANPAGITF